MPSDYGKKKASTKELRVCSPKGRKEEVYDSEEEEEAVSEEEEEYVPESGDDRSEADESHEERSGSEAEEDVEETPAHNVSPVKPTKPAKRKAETVRVKPSQQAQPNPAKKQKTTTSKPSKNTNEVKYKAASAKMPPAEEPMDLKDEKDEKDEKKTANKPTAMFSDKNVDLDLFHSSPTNVVSTKVKISPNLIMTSRNIDQLDGAKVNGQMYDFAALTFQRKINNGKLFEFVIPLGLAPKCLQAIQHIIDKNKKFFKPQDV